MAKESALSQAGDSVRLLGELESERVRLNAQVKELSGRVEEMQKESEEKESELVKLRGISMVSAGTFRPNSPPSCLLLPILSLLGHILTPRRDGDDSKDSKEAARGCAR